MARLKRRSSADLTDKPSHELADLGEKIVRNLLRRLHSEAWTPEQLSYGFPAYNAEAISAIVAKPLEVATSVKTFRTVALRERAHQRL